MVSVNPYVIQKKTFTDTAGRPATLNVGVLGFAPPQIMQWDKANLDGKVQAIDILEAARRYVPEMKAKGADIIIALNHSGIDSGEYQAGQEAAGAALSRVDGIDVVLSGHTHTEFPGAAYKEQQGANLERGTINGKPQTIPGYWRNNLGVIDLTLNHDPAGGHWQVTDSHAALRPIWDKANRKSLVEADPAIARSVQAQHEGTLQYVRSRVADLKSPINSYWATVQDDPSVQLVSNAQLAYAREALKGTPYAELPLLSAAAPFKAGGRGGVSNYTDIPAGTLAIKNVADLYVYPNTVQAVEVTGAQVQEWLERSAGQFNQIDPSKAEPQVLINDAFPTYNFDVIDGVTYEIDVTQPSRYDGKTLAHPEAHRYLISGSLPSLATGKL